MTESWDPPRRFVQIDDVRLHHELDGRDDAPVLALVNMASHNLTCWEPVLPSLREHFRVLRFDVRGTGRSTVGADAEYSFPRYAEDLRGLLDVLGIASAFVVGVAYGARTAARFALRHPERTAALGLFDVALTPPVVRERQRVLADEARALLREAGETIPEPRRSWRFYEDRETARLAHTAHEAEADPTPELARLHVPTLVACGRQDANLDEARRIAGLLPDAEFRIMERTGHASPFFRPALFCELLIDFAARRLGPGTRGSP